MSPLIENSTPEAEMTKGEEQRDWPQQEVEDIGDERMDVPTTDLRPEDRR